MQFLDKIGSNKEIYGVLKKAGWDGSYHRFATQKHRESFTTDVALILWDYCQKHKIPVSRKDFYKGE
jgi:hypothetical protein